MKCGKARGHVPGLDVEPANPRSSRSDPWGNRAPSETSSGEIVCSSNYRLKKMPRLSGAAYNSFYATAGTTPGVYTARRSRCELAYQTDCCRPDRRLELGQQPYFGR